MIIMIHNDNYINVSMSVYKLNLVSNKLHDIILIERQTHVVQTFLLTLLLFVVY